MTANSEEGGASAVVLVTGSSGGIGRAIVARFAEAGWRVVGTDRRKVESGTGPDRFVEADLSQEESIVRLVESVRAREGRLDALINNAAVQVCSPMDRLDADKWDHVMAVNLRAPFLCVREALPLLRASRGAVVNVSSVHAEHTSPQMSAYAASKGGLSAFTRAAALELAEHGIRVNAVVPGAVETQMLRRGLARDHLAAGGGDDAVEAFGRRQVLGRVADPVEIASVVMFLADTERASYVTGASIPVDGGVTARLSTE